MTQAPSSTPTESSGGSTTGQPARRRPFVAGETEARPGIITTEFWLAILASVVVVVAAYIDDGVADRLGWILATVILAAYVLSRGIAKAGSKEGPFIVGGGDQQ